jgi:hypothetical protein
MSGRRAKALRREALGDQTPIRHPTPWTDQRGVRHCGDQDAQYRRLKKAYVRRYLKATEEEHCYV